MIIVHHLNNSRSQRILWLLEELEVPYEIKLYYRNSMMLAPKELLDVHPLGKSPVITDGDVTLAESGAIIDYLIGKYANGKFKTSSELQYIDNLYYTHYAEGSLMPLLVMGLIFRAVPKYSPWFIRPLVRFFMNQLHKQIVDRQLVNHTSMVDKRLSEVKWIAGGLEPTAADFIMIFPLEGLAAMKVAGSHTLEYVQKVHERPAYKRAIEKGGEYAYYV
ncbi:thioredoxin-like protein [Hymenopellis radicata]|nr:thioredoxin-like protein [Hymenopellis radicata]